MISVSRRAMVGVTCLGLILTACAGQPVSQPSGMSGGAGGGGEVTFRSWSPIAQTTAAMVEATQAKEPGIIIKSEIFNYPEYLVDLNTRASSDTMPDIVGLQPGALTQQYRSKLMPLNDCAAKTWGENWKDKFHPIGLEQSLLGNPEGDENYYTLPLLVQTVNLWQNDELMKEKGVATPKTWEELQKASAAFNGSGKAGFMLPAKDSWLRNVVFLQIANNVKPGLVYEAEVGKAKWTDEAVVKAFEHWQKLFTDKIAQDGAMALDAYPNGANQFEAGGAAMIPLGAWWIQQSDPAKTDAPPLSQGLKGFTPFLFPTIAGGASESQLVGGVDVGLGISANTKNPDAACKVLTDWIAGAGAQVLINTFNDLPAVKGLEPEKFTSDHQKEVWDLMTTTWMPKVTYSRYLRTPDMDSALGDALAGLATGELTPDTAAQKVQAAQDAVLKK
ncbi:extracellular solute-binding protein [Schaalia sp. 19OD2882]|uniref:ABC transporter substrate-binding protein n=1 Tax=Schaalia sp. 19OD2882 TaxID=2794089 RepID=UPI001C1EF437|nr:extracellular solute-binding protein [Schaalia sp. 19OD2882]QWW20191.1 extracellular solute-binding protein [Schaalia sp. 19OD2882]